LSQKFISFFFFFETINLDRYFASNYWDCPIPNYSRSSSDYSTAKSQCGKKILRFFLREMKGKKLKQIDSSCPANKCLNGGKCSTRLNGNFYCQCLLPSFGSQCESGSSIFRHYSSLSLSFLSFLSHY